MKYVYGRKSEHDTLHNHVLAWHPPAGSQGSAWPAPARSPPRRRERSATSGPLWAPVRSRRGNDRRGAKQRQTENDDKYKNSQACINTVVDGEYVGRVASTNPCCSMHLFSAPLKSRTLPELCCLHARVEKRVVVPGRKPLNRTP